MAKILLVEDDLSLSQMIIDFLKGDRHSVEHAQDGPDGNSRLRVYSYDLIILDWVLPGMTGLEICKSFRSFRGKTPILMLTGRKDIDDKEAGLDAGADDYLTKPFQGRELLARVRALLRRQPDFTGDRLELAGFILEPSNYRAIYNGQEVQLAPREFALLEFLMRHPNQVFNIDALLDRVWPSDKDISPESVRVSIKRLRTKLGEPCPITTVHGAGYKLATS